MFVNRIVVDMECKESGEDVEIMSTNDALMFPVIASCTLFGIYVVFQVHKEANRLLIENVNKKCSINKFNSSRLQVFSKEYINFLLAFYFGLLGVIALTRTTRLFCCFLFHLIYLIDAHNNPNISHFVCNHYKQHGLFHTVAQLVGKE